MSSSSSEELQHLKRLRAYDQHAYAELESQLASAQRTRFTDERQDTAKRRIECISTKLRNGMNRLIDCEGIDDATVLPTLNDVSVDDSFFARAFSNDVFDDLEALASYVEEVCEAFDFYRIDSSIRLEHQMSETLRLHDELAEAKSTIERLEAELERKASDCEQADDTEIQLRRENARLHLRISALTSRQQVPPARTQTEEAGSSTSMRNHFSLSAHPKNSSCEDVKRTRKTQDLSISPKKKPDGQAAPLSDRTNRPRTHSEALICTQSEKHADGGEVDLPSSSCGRHDLANAMDPSTTREITVPSFHIKKHIRF